MVQEQENEVETDFVADLAVLVKHDGARTNAVEWAERLMENAPDFDGNVKGATGAELRDALKKIKERSKQGLRSRSTYHLGLYANEVRDRVLTMVPPKYGPVLVNVTKTAVAYLMKDPITRESIDSVVNDYMLVFMTRISNTISNNLVAIREASLTGEYLIEQEFYESLAGPLKKAYSDFLDEHVDFLLKPENISDE